MKKRTSKRYEMASDDNWLENAVAGNSVGKSKVELRAQRADIFAGLVTALAVDVAKELTVLSAMDIETIDPARHVETMTALLKADEFVTLLLLAIDEIKRQVAKPQRAGFRLANIRARLSCAQEETKKPLQQGSGFPENSAC